MTYTVTLVAVPEQAIAGLRERGPARELAARLQRLRRALEEAGVEAAGPVMVRRFDRRPESGASDGIDESDFEVAVPILPRPDGSVPDHIGEARGDLIPAHHAFTTEYRGPHDGLHLGFEAISRELDALGYAVAGPATEVYLRGPQDTNDPAAYVTLLRLPIAR
jgi:effector-binding domain-containing protein